ncbi:MAG: DUF2490 domain-containing protein [Pricia sp.]|nr:DUF2490 domain-containing protein [Pricia sp.]
MFCIRRILLVVHLLLGYCVLGQDHFTWYFEPDISLNYEVASNYSHNFEISQRSYIYDESFRFKGRQLDIAHFSALKITYGQSIALGIQYRFRNVFENDEENELRLTQQYNITTQRGGIRYGDRLRVEQRIRPSLTTHRFRYRFALDIPLSGEKLDVGEPYFIGSIESLLSVAKGNKPEFDQRLTTYLGWLLNTETKLQAGIEYRVENYTQQNENVLFFLTSLVFSL